MPIITQTNSSSLTNGNSGSLEIEVSNKTREASVTRDVILEITDTSYDISNGQPTGGFATMGHQAHWKDLVLASNVDHFLTIDWDVVGAPGSSYEVRVKAGDTVVETVTGTILGSGSYPAPSPMPHSGGAPVGGAPDTGSAPDSSAPDTSAPGSSPG